MKAILSALFDLSLFASPIRSFLCMRDGVERARREEAGSKLLPRGSKVVCAPNPRTSDQLKQNVFSTRRKAEAAQAAQEGRKGARRR